MTIYRYNGDVLYDAPITESAIIKRTLMADYYIELSFDVAEEISIGRGCYIIHDNNKYAIMSTVTPERKNGGYSYTLRFEAQQGIMKQCKCFWRTNVEDNLIGETLENIEVSFSNTTSLSQFAKLVCDNVNAFLGETRWHAGEVDSELDEAMKTISVNGDSCWDVVANIAETFNVEWWTNETTENVILNFGKLESGDVVRFTEGENVSSISYNRGDDSAYGTRFYVFGSTKNLPDDYSSTEQGGVTNHISEKRLHLPNGIKYIDATDFVLPTQSIVEQVVYFDDIFPTNVETVTIVHTDYEEVIEWQQDPVYTVYCMDSPFSFNYLIEGEEIKCTFTTGALQGRTFKVEIDTTTSSFNKRFKIIPNVESASAGIIIPNATLKPSANDKFILEGVKLPKGQITKAENELLKVGKEYAKKNSSNTEIFECPTNPIYCHNNDCNYELGQMVRVKGRASRIQGYEKKLYDPYQATYSVGDNSAYSRLGSLEKAIKQSSYGDRVGLETNIITSKADSTSPTDYNIYSALATEAFFLSLKRGGIVRGETDFRAGIKMFGQPLYDSELKRWFLDGDLVVSGGIAMYGNGGTTVPSIFESLPIDGETIFWDGGVLKAKGGTSGGGIDEAFLSQYLTDKKYLTDDVAAGKYLSITGGTASNLVIDDDAKYDNALTIRIASTQSRAGILLTQIGGGVINARLSTTNDYTLFENIYLGRGIGIDNSAKTPIFKTSSAVYTLVHSGNYSTLLANGSIQGAFAATQFIGNLIGNADSATRASILKASSTSKSWVEIKGNDLAIHNANSTQRFWFGYTALTDSPYATTKWYFGSSDGTGEPTGYVYAATFNGRLTGNANTATKLATKRALWGVDFDGTAPLTARPTFGEGVTIGDMAMYKLQDGVVYLEGNLVLKGSLAMYGTSGTIMPLSDMDDRIATIEEQIAQLQAELNQLKTS